MDFHFWSLYVFKEENESRKIREGRGREDEKLKDDLTVTKLTKPE